MTSFGYLAPPSKAFCFIWTIENYQFCLKNVVRSPVFTIDLLHSTTWQISCDPKGWFEGKPLNCSLHRLNDEGPDKVEITYMFIFRGSYDEVSTNKGKSNCSISKRASDEFVVTRKTLSGKITTTISNSNQVSRGNQNFTIRVFFWSRHNPFGELVRCFARTCIGIETKQFLWSIQEQGKVKQITLQPSSPLLPSMLLTMALGNGSLTINVHAIGCKNKVLVGCEVTTLDHYGRVLSKNVGELAFSTDTNGWHFATIFFNPKKVLHFNFDVILSAGIVLNTLQHFDDDDTIYGLDRYGFGKQGAGNVASQHLSNDLQLLLEKDKLSDKALELRTSQLAVQKTILSAVSPFFKDMFADIYKEATSQQIPIPELDEGTSKEIIFFIYSDLMRNLDVDNAFKLYATADQYGVDWLKRICSNFLKENLTPKNACDVLVLADDKYDKDLKEAVKGFIFRNDKAVFISDAFKSLETSRGQLCAEILKMKWECL